MLDTKKPTSGSPVATESTGGGQTAGLCMGGSTGVAAACFPGVSPSGSQAQNGHAEGSCSSSLWVCCGTPCHRMHAASTSPKLTRIQKGMDKFPGEKVTMGEDINSYHLFFPSTLLLCSFFLASERKPELFLEGDHHPTGAFWSGRGHFLQESLPL